MKIKLPAYLKGLSGKTGNVVFYKLYGKTYMRRAPGTYNKVPTAKQAAVRARFLAAQQFAKAVIADPVLKALYEQNLGNHISAYSKAVSEYMMGKVG